MRQKHYEYTLHEVYKKGSRRAAMRNGVGDVGGGGLDEKMLSS